MCMRYTYLLISVCLLQEVLHPDCNNTNHVTVNCTKGWAPFGETDVYASIYRFFYFHVKIIYSNIINSDMLIIILLTNY